MARRAWRLTCRTGPGGPRGGRRVCLYHCASPPYAKWPELFPALTRSILDAAESTGAKLVFADNLYAYGPVDGPLREDLPAVAAGRKGRTRVEMAAQLLAAHRNGQARVVIGRASDYYGPHGTGSTAGETVFGRILAGKKPQWSGRLDQPHTFHYLPDVARGLLVLADRREADGQVWHLPAAEPLTAQQFFDMIAKAAGQSVPVHASIANPAMLAVAGIFRHCSGRCARRPTSFARPSSSTPANSTPPSATWNRPRTATRCSGPSPGTGPADRRPPRAAGDQRRSRPLRLRPAGTSCAPGFPDLPELRPSPRTLQHRGHPPRSRPRLCCRRFPGGGGGCRQAMAFSRRSMMVCCSSLAASDPTPPRPVVHRARSEGVEPWSFVERGSAPARKSASTAAEDRFRTARCSGVTLPWARAFGSAPASIR